ncbi:hypothetical protein K435DRAFT_960625 [Dendrothele bispora CBS 962.96]|uniref:Uncharacterized protein n=1 Tax=Dendrothele bispora (strain CBS 962.96) TaxID=1314807 RepID=A0A4S8MTA6_DENBC|nr:hypothetical protein K435DRAFT_960625 [Dendrothele bispora CBS 962.96]
MAWAIGTGNCSDMDKAVERIWEFVTGNGEWIVTVCVFFSLFSFDRVFFAVLSPPDSSVFAIVLIGNSFLPLSPFLDDSTRTSGIYSSRVESLAANLKAYESIIKSVNLTQEQLEELKKAQNV